ncbi:hypothetical protein LguiA_005275 [Lonicera macranthoides]
MREKRLYEASLKGDIQSLTELMQEDELILEHRVPITCFNETPLHVAAMKGHVNFARAILQEKPDMVTELDSRGRSALHLASANGHVEIVKFLVTADPNVCFTEDEDGWTPLHLAAKKGRVEVVNELVQARPEVMPYPLNPAKAISIIHSYLIFNGLEALKHLVEADHNVLNYQDGDGNTILHKVTALKQTEVLEYAVSTSTELKINMVNAKGLTALDVIVQMPADFKTRQVHELLVKAGAKRGEISAMGHNINPLGAIEVDEIDEISTRVSVTVPAKPPSLRRPKSQHKIKNIKKMLKRKQGMLLMAATVIATMSYQAGLNPPGGVSDDQKIVSKYNGQNVTVQAGTSIMAAVDPKSFFLFWIFNTASFIGSISIILLVMSGLPLLRKRAFVWVLIGAICVITSLMAITYLVTLPAITPLLPESNWSWNVSVHIVKNSVRPLIGLVGSILLVHMFRFIMWIGKLWKYRKDKWVSREGDEVVEESWGQQVDGNALYAFDVKRKRLKRVLSD